MHLEAISYASGPRLFHSLTPRNLLSFGPETPPINLVSLNVLIGPNGSGKSNLLEVISLLRSTRFDCRDVISRGGGVAEWVWKGQPHTPASIDAVVSYPDEATSGPLGKQPLRHVFEFKAVNQTFQISDERIENEIPINVKGRPQCYYRIPGRTTRHHRCGRNKTPA